MSSRSGRHLREVRGFDSRGRCAFEFGQYSRLTPTAQRAAAIAAGHDAPPAAPSATVSADAGVDTMSTSTVVTFTNIASWPTGSRGTIRWGDGAESSFEVSGASATKAHTYATEGTFTITVDIAGSTGTDTFTAVEP
jgi:hypothetical protein